MMKYFQLIPMLFCVAASSQIQVTYKVTPLIKQTYAPLQRDNEEVSKVDFYLDIADNKSHFYFDNSMGSDGEDNVAFHRHMGVIINLNGTEFWTDWQANVKIEKSLRNVASKMENPGWKITSETKKIGDYDCFKASYTYEFVTNRGIKASRTVTAWFAPELPYPTGPTTFTGLPGLILELHNGEICVISATSVKTLSKAPKIVLPKDTISQEEDERALLNAKSDREK